MQLQARASLAWNRSSSHATPENKPSMVMKVARDNRLNGLHSGRIMDTATILSECLPSSDGKRDIDNVVVIRCNRTTYPALRDIVWGLTGESYISRYGCTSDRRRSNAHDLDAACSSSLCKQSSCLGPEFHIHQYANAGARLARRHSGFEPARSHPAL